MVRAPDTHLPAHQLQGFLGTSEDYRRFFGRVEVGEEVGHAGRRGWGGGLGEGGVEGGRLAVRGDIAVLDLVGVNVLRGSERREEGWV